MPRRTLRALDHVVAIRDLQMQAQELALAEARAELARRNERQAEDDEQARSALANWNDNLSSGRLNPTLSGLFGRALLGAEARLGQAREAVRDGERAQEAQVHALQLADARRAAAEQLRDDTARKARRRAEEKRMNDLADRVTLRSWRR